MGKFPLFVFVSDKRRWEGRLHFIRLFSALARNHNNKSNSIELLRRKDFASAKAKDFNLIIPKFFSFFFRGSNFDLFGIFVPVKCTQDEGESE